MLPWGDLVDGLTTNGWLDLGNARATMKVDGREVDVRGVDDPHISRDRYDEVAGPFDSAADLALGVTHAPYLRVLDAMAADGADLVLAGHTHGGQLCVPGVGALVTNCDLPRTPGQGPVGAWTTRCCTCPPGWAPRPTRRCASPAAPRRRC